MLRRREVHLIRDRDQLLPVRLDDVMVDVVPTRAGDRVNPERDVHRPARDRISYELLDVLLFGGVGVGTADADLEVAIVDRPHFSGDEPSAVLFPRVAISGHAQQHG